MLHLEGFRTVNGAAQTHRSRLALAATATFVLMASIAFAQPATLDLGSPGTEEILTTLADAKQEILEALKSRENSSTSWITAVGTFLTGFAALVIGSATVFASFKLRNLQTFADIDQSSHEKRVKLYPSFVKLAQPLALYFPQTSRLTTDTCKQIGDGLSKWYFETGGLLLSDDAKNIYFVLAEALTRASGAAKDLVVPVFPDDAPKLNENTIEVYRCECGLLPKRGLLSKAIRWALSIKDLPKPVKELRRLVLEWNFGEPDGREFKDYILIQYLSSRLRTALTEDLHSRVRPGATLPKRSS